MLLKYIRAHKIKTGIIVIILASLIGMAITGTLSYPYILVDRQIEMIKYCHFGTNELRSEAYGFTFSAPSEYCFLPNRTFPDDGTVNVIPKGWYFVINEYAKGSIVEATQATLLFEKIAPGRTTGEILDMMGRGGFLRDAKITTYTNKNGLFVTVAKDTTGLDEQGNHYSWAFITRPDSKMLLSVMTTHPDQSEIFDYVLENAGTTK